MEKLLDVLKQYGVDIEVTIARFVGDTKLYLKFAVEFTKCEEYMRLEEAVKNKDYNNVYKYAHSIKGLTGNLGFMKLYHLFAIIVDEAKDHRYNKIEESFNDAKKEYEYLCDLINKTAP